MPFDARFAAAMDAVGCALSAEASGAVCAYVASDEVSVLLTDFATPTTQPWFGGTVAKLVSVSAALASVTLNAQMGDHGGGRAVFDGRAFPLHTADQVVRYFRWRQADTVRNSVQMAARATFPHRDRQGKTVPQLREMLATAGVPWEAQPAIFRLGRLVTRHLEPAVVEYTHTRTGQAHQALVERSTWKPDLAPDLRTAEGRDSMSQVVPAHPDQ